VLRWALALLASVAATASFAQVSVTASLLSDDRFRGVSLTRDHPAAQLDVTYDHDSGWYAGAFGSNVEFDPGRPEAELIGYTGYARRLDSGWSLDGGAAYSTISGGDGYSYLELHAGVASQALSARLYFSPDYFGRGIRTLYAELNASHRVLDRVDLIGHAGVLQALSGATAQTGGTHPHVDLLAGVEARVQRFTLQLGRVTSDGARRVYPVYGQTSGAWTARLSARF